MLFKKVNKLQRHLSTGEQLFHDHRYKKALEEFENVRAMLLGESAAALSDAEGALVAGCVQVAEVDPQFAARSSKYMTAICKLHVNVRRRPVPECHTGLLCSVAGRTNTGVCGRDRVDGWGRSWATASARWRRAARPTS